MSCWLSALIFACSIPLSVIILIVGVLITLGLMERYYEAGSRD